MFGEPWSKEEIKASVETYLEMLHMELSGQPFVKKEYYQSLVGKFGRSIKAYEYRMQNISHVLAEKGQVWVKGLKPARNVGTNVAAEIERQLGLAEKKTKNT
jgi:5-methylcytosine-specific restriction protein A